MALSIDFLNITKKPSAGLQNARCRKTDTKSLSEYYADIMRTLRRRRGSHCTKSGRLSGMVQDLPFRNDDLRRVHGVVTSVGNSKPNENIPSKFWICSSKYSSMPLDCWSATSSVPAAILSEASELVAVPYLRLA